MKTERNYWTKHDEAVLARVYATSTRDEMEQMLGRKSANIYQKAFKLGLKKDSQVISSQASKWMKNKNRKEK